MYNYIYIYTYIYRERERERERERGLCSPGGCFEAFAIMLMSANSFKDQQRYSPLSSSAPRLGRALRGAPAWPRDISDGISPSLSLYIYIYIYIYIYVCTYVYIYI